jgi:hypothetical protein
MYRAEMSGVMWDSYMPGSTVYKGKFSSLQRCQKLAIKGTDVYERDTPVTCQLASLNEVESSPFPDFFVFPFLDDDQCQRIFCGVPDCVSGAGFK